MLISATLVTSPLLKYVYFSDDVEAKSGFKNACSFINTQMSQFFKGRELPLTKKVFDQLANWVERQRHKM